MRRRKITSVPPQAPYTNDPNGVLEACELSGLADGTLDPQWNACDGGVIYVNYSVVVCGETVTKQCTITVTAAPQPEISCPTSLPTSLTCAEAEDYLSAPQAPYTNDPNGVLEACELSGLADGTLDPQWNACDGGVIYVNYSVVVCGETVTKQCTITVTAAPQPEISCPTSLPTSLTCAEAEDYLSAPQAPYTNDPNGVLEACELSGLADGTLDPQWNACDGGVIYVNYSVVVCGETVTKQCTITVTAAPQPEISCPTSLPTSLTCAEAEDYLSAPQAPYTNDPNGVLEACELSGLADGTLDPQWNACDGGVIYVNYSVVVCGETVTKQCTITVTAAPQPEISCPTSLPTSLTCAEAEDYLSAPQAPYTNDPNGVLEACELSGLADGTLDPQWNACDGGVIYVNYSVVVCGETITKQCYHYSYGGTPARDQLSNKFTDQFDMCGGGRLPQCTTGTVYK